ncbi:MAG: 3-deoxy-8-phosphooctulonate synthase [Candidatus Abyssobacteria bacterium SURF_5]|uniref:3-deoxy-8-phosphooctulonate synthase n=1 Tax=Abyssobacteria bacterium (strain SURF_5) TaxID=2093360 RepID=A0A3A4P044_ABYX5|nr:MAG: 3-deoxy-8-phosphooctulonate synthase [Candidatus Abyssubacteria bacterium SURF_5]
MQDVRVGDIVIGHGRPLALIAGPCVLEEESITFETARFLAGLRDRLSVPVIFKSSYEKDNRGSEKSYIGPGVIEGCKTLKKVKREFGLPVLSDVHRLSDIDVAAEYLDVLQIPAYLCQQTSLLLKAGAAGKPVNVKKGQFIAPDGMSSAVGKILSTGNNQILLTERGSCFGYNNLVSDICSIPVMQALGFPVVFDATHIVRVYGLPSKDPRGGKPEYVPHLMRAGVAAGSNALFLECHPAPMSAKCDAASMIPLAEMQALMEQALEIAEVVRKRKLA